MARQIMTPADFARTVRHDRVNGMTSGRAGVVVPIDYIPLFAGDSAAGRFGIDIEMQEMPRPLLNGVVGQVQAWLVTKLSHPKFTSYEEYIASKEGVNISALGASDRTPPDFFTTIEGADYTTAAASEFMKKLGLHLPAGEKIHSDLIDAFWQVYNFRLAAHSSKLTLQGYAADSLANSTALPRAFWPKAALTNVVPDYESALVVGALDLDVTAGQLPVSGILVGTGKTAGNIGATSRETQGVEHAANTKNGFNARTGSNDSTSVFIEEDADNPGYPGVFAEMAGQGLTASLADIDKARTTQAFAKLRAAYAGNDITGYMSDDAILAQLMRGVPVPQDEFQRPILLDSQLVRFGFLERHATDAANLDDSISQGRTSASLSLNVPTLPTEAVIIITFEMMPELLQEAQYDDWLHMEEASELPDALRDIQRTEPVDIVPNKRRDARHTSPDDLYGYEPMNYKWDRNFTRLGGDFYQDNPSNPFTEQRSGIWQANIVDPSFTGDHWLVPASLDHSVFSDSTADAFEAVFRHDLAITGLTQMGDMLDEDNTNFAVVEAAGATE
jgi:hypothetical protein